MVKVLWTEFALEDLGSSIAISPPMTKKRN